MWQPASSSSIGTIFPKHLLSLCHILVIFSIFEIFYYYIFIFLLLYFYDLWSVVFHVTVIVIWGQHKPRPYRMVYLTDTCCVGSDCSTNRLFPRSIPLLGRPDSMRNSNIEIRTINNPTVAPKYSSERKGHMFLPLNQKLKWLSSWGRHAKSWERWKTRPLMPTAKLWMQR